MKRCLLFALFCLTPFLFHAAPLPAKDVFQVQVLLNDPNNFTIQWTIKPGYFLYSDRIKVKQQTDSNIHLGPLRFPTPQVKIDKQGHRYTVYRNTLSLPISVLNDEPGEALLDLHYQGCADDGFCYPPEDKQIKLTIDKTHALSHIELEPVAAPLKESTNPPKDEIAKLFKTSHWGMIFLTFFGFGLLLSFTPCILPMVPVLSGIIVGHGKEVTTRKAFFLSLSYVLSMSATYALIGAVVAMLGANLQINMQSPWAISLFSLVFILLALSMFGFYEFKLPSAWQAKIAGPSGMPRGGHYLGAAIMGCLSTLILSPCVTAPLIGVLTYIAQTGNVFLGSLTLFILSLGMGTPLLLIGTSAGKWLPESGAWMNVVKAFFGILFIAVAIFLMSRILPAGVTMALWASLLIFSGLYCGALTPAPSNLEKFYQGVGIILLSYGLLILIGASIGATNPLQPLDKIPATTLPQAYASPTAQRQTLNEIKQLIKQARGKPVMLDFYADWCTSCKIMEAGTLKNPQVQAALSHFVVLKIDVTANSVENKKILAYFNVVAPPTFLFYNAEGRPMKSEVLVGEQTVDEFSKTLSHVYIAQ